VIKKAERKEAANDYGFEDESARIPDTALPAILSDFIGGNIDVEARL